MILRHKILAISAVLIVATTLMIALLSGVYLLRSEQPLVRMMGGWLPVASVSGNTVSYGDYLTHVDAQRVFLTGPLAQDSGAVREITDSERREAYERAIRIRAVEGLAEEADVEVTPLDVDRAYQDLVARAGSSTTKEEIQTFLKAQFGWDESEYKANLLRPAFTEEILRTKGGEEFDRLLQARIDGASRYLSF